MEPMSQLVFMKMTSSELKKKRGNITGVGSAKAKGIGTIHWKLRTDSGKYIDVFIRDAL